MMNRYKEYKLRRHARRCDGEVTTMVPPGATEEQVAIEFCDHGYWYISVLDYFEGGVYFPDKNLPDEFWNSMERAEGRLRKAGLDHVASSIRRLLSAD